MSNQKTLIRCMKMMEYLMEKPRQVYNLVEYLNVSERTIYRYFRAFEQIGYTVEKDEFGKYTLKK